MLQLPKDLSSGAISPWFFSAPTPTISSQKIVGHFFFEKKTFPQKLIHQKLEVNDLSNIFLKPNLPQPRCAQVTQKSPVPNLGCCSGRLASIVSLCIFFRIKHHSFWFILNTGKPVDSMVCTAARNENAGITMVGLGV